MINLLKILRFIISHPLNKDRKIQAILSFFRWQIGSKLIGGKVVVKWINDARLLLAKGEISLTGNLYSGLMEFEEMLFLLHYLKSEDDFFDIGANVGSYTVLASSVKGCSAHAFEPVPETFHRLIDQVKLNRVETLVDLRNCGVGASTSELEFTTSHNCTNRVNTDPNNTNVVKIPVIALDDEFIPTRNTLVKIDVEGFEMHVLDGGSNFFLNPNVSVLIIETNGSGLIYGSSDSDIDETLRKHGFRSVRYDPFTRTLRETDSFNQGLNTIYVKDIALAAARCRLAEEVQLHTASGIHI